VVRIIAFGLAVSAIYTAAFGILDEVYHRSLTVGFSALLVLFSTPLATLAGTRSRPGKAIAWTIDLAMTALLAFAIYWFISFQDAIQSGLVVFDSTDIAIGVAAVLVILELTRRIFGLPLVALAAISIGYALYGQSLPWIFAHAGYSWEETIRTVWYSFDGVFGLPVIVVISLVFIFVVFGALLEGTGAGQILLRIAFALTGRLRGGPAHAAVAASGLFGTISGSVSANVVGTGVFTIPLIKRRGFSASFAGGVEAAASSGGQFMPPIMGAVAFFMADLTGVPYLTIIAAALVPALFYYASLFCAVWVEAGRRNIQAIPKDQRPTISVRDRWLSVTFVGPIVVIIAVLLAGRSPAMAGVWAIAAAVALGFLDPVVRHDPARLIRALASGGEQGGRIIVAVATIGIIIAIMNQTGLGIRFSTAVLSLAGDDLFFALVLLAAACLVLGMGLPTVPAYLIVILIMGSAIEKLGVPKLLVHLFVVYFAVLSAITPPVAIAAYAAAPIARSNPFDTAVAALRLSLVGFAIPFAFVYNPSLTLVVGFEWPAFLWIVLRLALSVWLLTTGLGGVDSRPLPHWSRAARVLLGVAVLIAEWRTQLAALLLGCALVAFERARPGGAKPQATTPEAEKGGETT
jgi:TRAP transporter 4TM/12TM fusion protein